MIIWVFPRVLYFFLFQSFTFETPLFENCCSIHSSTQISFWPSWGQREWLYFFQWVRSHCSVVVNFFYCGGNSIYFSFRHGRGLFYPGALVLTLGNWGSWRLRPRVDTQVLQVPGAGGDTSHIPHCWRPGHMCFQSWCPAIHPRCPHQPSLPQGSCKREGHPGSSGVG